MTHFTLFLFQLFQQLGLPYGPVYPYRPYPPRGQTGWVTDLDLEQRPRGKPEWPDWDWEKRPRGQTGWVTDLDLEQRPQGRACGDSCGGGGGVTWQGNGNGFGNINDNINVGIGGQGGTIVTKQVKGDGTVITNHGWNQGINGQAGFMKGIGGGYGGYGQGIGGQGQGNVWGGAGLNGGLGATGGTTTIVREGGDGSFVRGSNTNIGLGGNVGAGVGLGGQGGGSLGGPCGTIACGNGGFGGYGGVGLNGGIGATSGHMVERVVGENGGFSQKTSSTWGIGGNLGGSIGLGGNGGWRAKYGGRSAGGFQEPIYRQQRPPARGHPYMKTLEGMYSSEMNPRASIIMIDDPVGKTIKPQLREFTELTNC